jgi:hypothetical protein
MNDAGDGSLLSFFHSTNSAASSVAIGAVVRLPRVFPQGRIFPLYVVSMIVTDGTAGSKHFHRRPNNCMSPANPMVDGYFRDEIGYFASFSA